MIFNSFNFIVFFIVVLITYYLLPHRFRWALLLLASCIFYMAWNPFLMILLVFSVAVNHFTSLRIDEARTQSARKTWLVLCLVINFGILFIFKYLVFFTGALYQALHVFGMAFTPPEFSIILPMGISFYTFQATGYTIDVYRKEMTPERNFLKFLLFITFFPQLVAGPIERAGQLLPQLFSKKKFQMDNLTLGFKYMIFGFFQKVVIADRIAASVNTVYNMPTHYEGLSFILATLLFAFQIYCDFGGYSNIAIGCAKMLGIDLMENFKQPFLSGSIRELWQRWHVSLSTWFKDYVYFPLGGSRVNKARHYFNTMVTFVLSGLWHGANWTFIIWGGLHGIFQCFETMFAKPDKHRRLPTRLLRIIATFTLFCFTLIFFRANDIDDALHIVSHLFTGHANWMSAQYVLDVLYNMGTQLFDLAVGVIAIIFLIVVECCCGKRNVHAVLMKTPGAFRFCFYFLLTISILSLGVFYNAGQFIYFQF